MALAPVWSVVFRELLLQVDDMHHVFRLDLPTLYACHLLICLVAGVVFLLLRPSVKIRGLRWIAANFFLDALFLLLMLTRSEWHRDFLRVAFNCHQAI